MRDFSPSTLRALARKGIRILSIVAIPDMKSAMPWANAERGYSLDDNGCNKVRTHAEVMEMAA